MMKKQPVGGRFKLISCGSLAWLKIHLKYKKIKFYVIGGEI
jgi:hypothetical protein